MGAIAHESKWMSWTDKLPGDRGIQPRSCLLYMSRVILSFLLTSLCAAGQDYTAWTNASVDPDLGLVVDYRHEIPIDPSGTKVEIRVQNRRNETVRGLLGLDVLFSGDGLVGDARSGNSGSISCLVVLRQYESISFSRNPMITAVVGVRLLCLDSISRRDRNTQARNECLVELANAINNTLGSMQELRSADWCKTRDQLTEALLNDEDAQTVVAMIKARADRTEARYSGDPNYTNYCNVEGTAAWRIRSELEAQRTWVREQLERLTNHRQNHGPTNPSPTPQEGLTQSVPRELHFPGTATESQGDENEKAEANRLDSSIGPEASHAPVEQSPRSNDGGSNSAASPEEAGVDAPRFQLSQVLNEHAANLSDGIVESIVAQRDAQRADRLERCLSRRHRLRACNLATEVRRRTSFGENQGAPHFCSVGRERLLSYVCKPGDEHDLAVESLREHRRVFQGDGRRRLGTVLRSVAIGRSLSCPTVAYILRESELFT
jgi:hypothetical protein